jgi:hypothetical protein
MFLVPEHDLGSKCSKSHFFNRNLMFLFAIIGDAVMKLEFNACL